MTAVTDLKQQLNITDDTDDALLDRIAATALVSLANDIGAETPAAYEDLPAPLQHAVMLKAAHFYENREATLVGFSAQTMPMGYADLIETYVRRVF